MFISEKGVIKIGDFGLADQLNSSASIRSGACGTFMYLAPEVFDDQACLKSDVWSLGISLIELAEGKNPYASMKSVSVNPSLFCHSQIFKKIVLEDPPSLVSSHWSSDFVSFVSQCLKKDVNERPSASALMQVFAYAHGSRVARFCEGRDSAHFVGRKVGRHSGDVEADSQPLVHGRVHAVQQHALEHLRHAVRQRCVGREVVEWCCVIGRERVEWYCIVGRDRIK